MGAGGVRDAAVVELNRKRMEGVWEGRFELCSIESSSCKLWARAEHWRSQWHPSAEECTRRGEWHPRCWEESAPSVCVFLLGRCGESVHAFILVVAFNIFL